MDYELLNLYELSPAELYEVKELLPVDFVLDQRNAHLRVLEHIFRMRSPSEYSLQNLLLVGIEVHFGEVHLILEVNVLFFLLLRDLAL